VGRVIDIAETIGFLFSDETNWITGVVRDVDGGAMTGRNR
jgi:NAD(P)-dependent dehydrogenase (short-subunit alcohol dehydrogenase family)